MPDSFSAIVLNPVERLVIIMDRKFWRAWGAIRESNVELFESILSEHPSLAIERSSVGHPTLMQALVLDAVEAEPEVQLTMARKLRSYNAPVDEPLISAGSLGNTLLAEFLVGEGAAIDGVEEIMRGWSVVEEALYWQNLQTAKRMIELGASIRNLRVAAGIGDLTAVAGFFDSDGRLRSNAGDTNFPFCMGQPEQVVTDAQAVIDNALVYAASSGHRDVASYLLERDAEVNAIPLGFHVRGSALHFAAMNGREAMCELLLDAGANAAQPDLSEEKRPASAWAAYGGYPSLEQRLTSRP